MCVLESNYKIVYLLLLAYRAFHESDIDPAHVQQQHYQQGEGNRGVVLL